MAVWARCIGRLLPDESVAQVGYPCSMEQWSPQGPLNKGGLCRIKSNSCLSSPLPCSERSGSYPQIVVVVLSAMFVLFFFCSYWWRESYKWNILQTLIRWVSEISFFHRQTYIMEWNIQIRSIKSSISIKSTNQTKYFTFHHVEK